MVAKTQALGLAVMRWCSDRRSKKNKTLHLQNEGLLRKGRLLELITRPEYIVEWEKLYDLIQGPVEAPQCPSENKNPFENQGTDAKNQAVMGD